MKIGAHFILLVTVFGYSLVMAQEPKTPPPEPKTKLEAFEKQTGMVLIKGFSTVGSISGMDSVMVNYREFIEPSTGKKQYGIVIEVSSRGRFERQDRLFIDYDEIEPLIKGIDCIAKVGLDCTKLGSFEAVYKTKDDLSVIIFSTSSGKIEDRGGG